MQPHRVLFFSSNGTLDAEILGKHKLVNWHVPLPLAGARYTRPMSIIKLFFAFIIAIYHLLKHRPKQLITTGGISALPTCCAAFLLRIPITLYELNAIPGKATKALAPLANQIAICFPEAARFFSHQKTTLSAYPLHFDPAQIAPQHARQNLDIPTGKKVLCIVGGSQGSQFINNAIKALFQEHPQEADRLHIIHQVGLNSVREQEEWYRKRGIGCHIFAYTNQLQHYLAAADLIVCRSGAGTLFECAALGVPFITIPLENVAAGHQVANAVAMARMHPNLCQVLQQQQLLDRPSLLSNAIRKML